MKKSKFKLFAALLLAAAMTVLSLSGAVPVLADETAAILANAAKSPAVHTAPEGYDQNDFTKVRTFLEQTDSNGIRNGEKLNPDGYDPDDPESWGALFVDEWGFEHEAYFDWEEVDGINRMFAINLTYIRDFAGTFDMSGLDALSTLDVDGGNFTTADLSNCYEMTHCYFANSTLSSVNFFNCANVTELYLQDNELTEVLNLGDCTSLLFLDILMNSDLEEIDLSTIADDYQTAVKALAMPTNKMRGLQTKAGYYRGYFNLKKVGDTFINMEAFGKGQVYVNGHALGRFWQIGPQQTLYLPGCWLKKGKNEVIVLDVVGPKGEAGKPGSNVAPTAFCQDHPELDKLNLEKSNKHNDPGHRMDLNSETPVLKGEFKSGNGWQTIKLDKPVTGRYFAIQAESSQSGDSQIAIAEVYLQDASGNRIDRNNWVAFYADSEKGNSTLDKMFDLQESTYWQTEKGANFPHLGIVDMGKEVTISAFEYLPRAEQGAPGSVKAFKLYVKK